MCFKCRPPFYLYCANFRTIYALIKHNKNVVTKTSKFPFGGMGLLPKLCPTFQQGTVGKSKAL